MRVRLAVSPIGWKNDDLPEIGADIPLERVLAEAALAGYAGIERGGSFPTEPEVLRRLLARYGLVLVGGWVSGRLLELGVEAELRRLAPTLELFRACGASVLVYAETSGSIQTRRQIPLERRPRLDERGLADLARALSEVARHCADAGVPLAYHHHMGTVVETAAEVDALMRASHEAVGLLLDTGHLVFAGADPLEVARRWRARIRHVHFKDVRPAVLAQVRAKPTSFLDAVLAGVFTVPGDPTGCTDFAAVAQVLHQGGYDGWVVVEAEQDPARAEPFTYARLGRAATEAALLAAEVAA